ncbi:MAG: hypothetical protein IIX15_01295 [Clostridia bacterium]|nr:hypothetical protein [Clostridia bacterium]
MKKQSFRLLGALVGILLLLSALTSCGASQKTVMSLGEQTLTINEYELLLSRMKGTLEYNGYPIDEDSFWNQIISAQGATYDDFFCVSVQDEAKKMLAKQYLFEEVYNLSLPQTMLDDVDQFLDDAIQLNFDGSKAAFNSYLSSYGVNIKMLRENYIVEEKLDYLASYVSSITGDAARDEYYNNNYVCFRQILFPLYEYVYETDESGDVIYYYKNSDKIYYDMSAATRTDADGKVIVDENGDTVYYTEDGRIAYNVEKGVPHGADKDNDGYVDYVELDDESKKIVTDRAQALSELIAKGDFTTFEEYGDQWSGGDDWEGYPNGIYVNLNKSYQINYMDDIQAKLSDMEIGETALVISENAYHFIMKYELPKQGYANEENADWFGTFEDELVSSILDAMCEEYLGKINVNAEALSKAKTMKTVGSNIEY